MGTALRWGSARVWFRELPSMVGLARTDSCTPCAAGEYSEEAAARCALAFILGCRIGFRVQDLEVLGGGGVLFCVSVWVYSEVSSRF